MYCLKQLVRTKRLIEARIKAGTKTDELICLTDLMATCAAIVGAAHWRPAGDAQLLHGEAVVDDAVLFDGVVAGVRIEPTVALPGLRARVWGGRSRRCLAGRAAQLGSTGAAVDRDGVPALKATRRSTIYRNTEGWLLVR